MIRRATVLVLTFCERFLAVVALFFLALAMVFQYVAWRMEQ